jgi:transposase-like protein
MPQAKLRDPMYRGRRFAPETIEQCVRWYITYGLSYRDLAAMMAEQGVSVTHTTIMRWVLRYVPDYQARWARFARGTGNSWRMDETAIPVRGLRCYLYRAVDKSGKSIGSVLCGERSVDAAVDFFREAMEAPGATWPRTINLDGNVASRLAVRVLARQDRRWCSVKVRTCRYLNNIVEQDHRAVKRRCRGMLGFKSFRTAAITLSGIELAHRIRKHQFRLEDARLDPARTPCSLRELWALALDPRRRPSVAVKRAPSMHQNSFLRKRRDRKVRDYQPRRYARKVFLGGGLFIHLTPSGGRHWRYKYHYARKEKLISLGSYPDVPLEAARARHRFARQLLAAGEDPSRQREQVRNQWSDRR